MLKKHLFRSFILGATLASLLIPEVSSAVTTTTTSAVTTTTAANSTAFSTSAAIELIASSQAPATAETTAEEKAVETTAAASAESTLYTSYLPADFAIPMAGISKLIVGTNVLAIAEEYKDAGERDWEVRADAVKDYENFGISVVDSYLNVRLRPDEDSTVIGKMTNFNACNVIGPSKDKKWYKITSGSVTGWVSTDYIKTGWEGIDLGKAEAELQIKINVDTLNVREEADENSAIWTQANVNEKYDVVKDYGEWVEIELDDSTGFVKSEYVTQTYSLNTAVKYTAPKEERQQTLRDKIVAYAMKWLGGKYVWGGETLGKGVDCSGFVMKIYQNFGVYLTHHSGTMAHEGTKISRSSLKKGDLIFYARGGSINHVAMYIGDGQVIHARSRRRGICITDMDYRTPVRFVRYLDD